MAKKLPHPTNFEKWTWGDDLSAIPTSTIAKGKQSKGFKTACTSIPSLFSAKWSIYDAKIEISIDNLPPANVVLSDRIAHDLSQFLAIKPVMAKTKLSQYWPGNYDSSGCFVKCLHPVGSPALRYVDNKPAYAVFGGRIWIGEPGLQEAEKEAEPGLVAMVRQNAPWWKPTREEITLGYSFRWNPGNAEGYSPSLDWDRFPSSLLNEARFQSQLQSYDVDQLRANNEKFFGKNTNAPSHPDLQTYKWVVDVHKAKNRNKEQAPAASSTPTTLQQHMPTATNLLTSDADVAPCPSASNTTPARSQTIAPTQHLDRLSRRDSLESETSFNGFSDSSGSNVATTPSNSPGPSVQQAHHVAGAPEELNDEGSSCPDDLSAIVQTILNENTTAFAKLERTCLGSIPDTKAILNDMTEGQEQAINKWRKAAELRKQASSLLSKSNELEEEAISLWTRSNERGASNDRLNDLQEEVEAVKEQLEKSKKLLRKVLRQLTSQVDTNTEATARRSSKRKSVFQYVDRQSSRRQRRQH